MAGVEQSTAGIVPAIDVLDLGEEGVAPPRARRRVAGNPSAKRIPMKRLIVLAGLAIAMTFAAACNTDDAGSGAPVVESNSIESSAPVPSPAS